METKQNNTWAIILNHQKNVGDVDESFEEELELEENENIKRTWLRQDEEESSLGKTFGVLNHIIPEERVLIVVSEKSDPAEEKYLLQFSADNILFQPSSLCSAAQLLLPLLEIKKREPNAYVVVIPHNPSLLSLDRGNRLCHSISEAINLMQKGMRETILFGFVPNELQRGENGLIVESIDASNGGANLNSIRSLIPYRSHLDDAEKIDVKASGRGVLWNTSIMVGNLDTILFQYMTAAPDLVRSLIAVKSDREKFSNLGNREFFDQLPHRDLMRDILGVTTQFLRVMPVQSGHFASFGVIEHNSMNTAFATKLDGHHLLSNLKVEAPPRRLFH